MSKILEYIWLDGEGGIRCKTRVVDDSCKIPPRWRFDGGSTEQGDVENSDCTLDPVRVYYDGSDYIVLCEALDSKGSPLLSNTRADLRYESDKDDNDIWVGVEQEFTIKTTSNGPFDPNNCVYPGNGYCRSYSVAENIIIRHMKVCLGYGIQYAGFNSEVTQGQWEFQIGPDSPLKVADDLIVARHLLIRAFAYSNISITFHPKPFKEFNGAGCHINISTEGTRDKTSDPKDIAWMLEPFHEDFIENAYGDDNEFRMTGTHETSDIDVFSIGVGSRNTSIRLPNGDSEVYIEDRRPAANIDPYKAFSYIMEVINE